MKSLQVEVTLLSPLQLGSGKADVILDSEAVHDRYGLPYFPGKRFKGLLYESAIEMAEISNGSWFTKEEVDALFGHGSSDTVAMRIDNLTLNDYEKKQEQWQYLQTSFPELFNKDALWESYTSVRYQTAIDENGIADEGSLHNLRVVDVYVDARLKFTGSICLLQDVPKAQEILKKALMNLRYAGAKRNRGCGHIRCRLVDVSKGK
jgi:CRISPR/Cas system CSM-associated protein Csm3 (group 7 of RAMP superfamily)